MKTLTVEEQKYFDTLNTVAGEITQRIITACDDNGQPKYAHMIEMWKAFLGGFICKEMGDLTDLTDEQKTMIEMYTPEAIEKLLTKEVIKEIKVEVPVEKIVYRDKIVEVPVQQASVSSSSSTVVKTGGQERRRYNQRARNTEKVRDLMPSERQYMIEKFNDLQRLIDKDSTECKEFQEHLNGLHGTPLNIFSSQLAGYWSILCKRVCGIDGNVEDYYANAVKYGKLLQGCPKPHASDDFKKVILENLINNKAEAKRIAEYQQIYRGLLTKV